MNMTPEKFESQVKYLKDNGFTIIPLQEAVNYLQGKRDALPKKPIVITADDGWESNFTYMLPIVKKYNIPVTLFIYPQTISEGKNALTWDQLKQLHQTGLFDVQSHTYDHPNFKQARKRMSPETYAKYVKNQLVNSKKILEEKLGTKVSFLAWPFGIYDDYLEKQAHDAGYDMAFTIDYRPAKRTDRAMAEPRFMIIDAATKKTYAGLVGTANG
jgi:peptidoglycan/xylan/chitin deacetylase (PgdA/CDA1 family)